MHCLQIKGSQIDITHTWQLEGPVTTVMYSPDHEILLLSSNTVSTCMYHSVNYCTYRYSPNNNILHIENNYWEHDSVFVFQGQIYVLNPTESDNFLKVLDVLCGNFVAAHLSHTGKNICVVKPLCCSRSALL